MKEKKWIIIVTIVTVIISVIMFVQYNNIQNKKFRRDNNQKIIANRKKIKARKEYDMCMARLNIAYTNEWNGTCGSYMLEDNCELPIAVSNAIERNWTVRSTRCLEVYKIDKN